MLIPMIVRMIRKSQNKKILKLKFVFDSYETMFGYFGYIGSSAVCLDVILVFTCVNQLLSWTRSFLLSFYLNKFLISASVSGSASASVRHLSPYSPTASAPWLLLWWFCLLHTPTSGWRKSLTLRIYIYISHLVTKGEDKFVS